MSTSRTVPTEQAICRRLLLLLFGVLAFTACMRWAYVAHNHVIVDEFQHLHAAYLTARGQTPYVDFFEHHTPLFYYLASVLLPMDQPDFGTIIAARHLALLFNAIGLLVAWLWITRSFGRLEGVVVAALLASNFFLFARGSLSYLDTYAAPCLIASALFLSQSRGRPLNAFLSGAALVLALLFTQKAAVVVLAPAAWLASRGAAQWRSRAGRSAWLSEVIAYAAGGMVAALLLPALLGLRGLDDFFRDNVALNLAWKARHFPRRELMILAVTGGSVYFAALVGGCQQLGRILGRIFRRHLALEPDDVPTLFLLALAAGVVLLPVVWEEYFILVVPFASIVAGITLARWSRQLQIEGRLGIFTAGRSRAVSLAIAAVVALDVANLIARKLVSDGGLSRPAFVAVVGLWTLLAFLLLRARGQAATRTAVLWLAFAVAFPLLQQADWIYHKVNDDQRRRLQYVLETTGSDDTVFDGYSGLGVFRPHAYTFWFLHDEVQEMLTREEKTVEIIAALDRQATPIVIADGYVDALPAEVRVYIDENYEDTPFPDIKRRKTSRQALPSPQSHPSSEKPAA